MEYSGLVLKYIVALSECFFLLGFSSPLSQIHLVPFSSILSMNLQSHFKKLQIHKPFDPESRDTNNKAGRDAERLRANEKDRRGPWPTSDHARILIRLHWFRSESDRNLEIESESAALYRKADRVAMKSKLKNGLLYCIRCGSGCFHMVSSAAYSIAHIALASPTTPPLPLSCISFSLYGSILSTSSPSHFRIAPSTRTAGLSVAVQRQKSVRCAEKTGISKIIKTMELPKWWSRMGTRDAFDVLLFEKSVCFGFSTYMVHPCYGTLPLDSFNLIFLHLQLYSCGISAFLLHRSDSWSIFHKLSADCQHLHSSFKETSANLTHL